MAHACAQRIRFFSNPSTFMIQEIVFGVCSYDVLLDLTKQGRPLSNLLVIVTVNSSILICLSCGTIFVIELGLRAAETSQGCDSDRMTRLANHLIEQRR